MDLGFLALASAFPAAALICVLIYHVRKKARERRGPAKPKRPPS